MIYSDSGSVALSSEASLNGIYYREWYLIIAIVTKILMVPLTCELLLTVESKISVACVYVETRWNRIAPGRPVAPNRELSGEARVAVGGPPVGPEFTLFIRGCQCLSRSAERAAGWLSCHRPVTAALPDLNFSASTNCLPRLVRGRAERGTSAPGGQGSG